MGMRVGWYFFLIGLVIMFVFSASYAIENPSWNLFLIAFLCMALGLFMIVKNRRPPTESERFRRLRKLRKKK